MLEIHVTMHNKGTKLDGIQSVGTTSLCNPICQMRKKIPGSICEACFGDCLCKCRKSLNEHLSANYEKLTSRLLTKAEAQAVPVFTMMGRIESFGDVGNVIQARNYIRIIRNHPFIRWAVWTKNWGIWLAAFKAEGKPRNMTFVLSSFNVNERMAVHPLITKYVDHIFTVWDKAMYILMKFKGGKTECAGLSCTKCEKCWKRKGQKGYSFYIDEVKR